MQDRWFRNGVPDRRLRKGSTLSNPYQSPRQTLTSSTSKASLASPWWLQLSVFVSTAGVVYFIGLYSLGQADGSDFPSTYFCIAALAFFAAFLAQPMTEFGIFFCTIFSCVIWGLIANKIVDYFWKRSQLKKLASKGETE